MGKTKNYNKRMVQKIYKKQYCTTTYTRGNNINYKCYSNIYE